MSAVSDPAAVLAALGEGWEPYTPDGLTIQSARGTFVRLAFGQVRYTVSGEFREALFVDSCTPEEIAELAHECDERADQPRPRRPTHKRVEYIVQYGVTGSAEWSDCVDVLSTERYGREYLATLARLYPETPYRLVKRTVTETVIA